MFLKKYRFITSSLVFLVNVVIVKGQSDVKSSLTFVIDNTASMGDDIEQVIEHVKLVFETITHSKNSQVDNFVLVTFNDPDAQTLAVTKDESVFMRALENISLRGNWDCPEYAMKGIEKALRESLPSSYFYVFTDASAKDYTEIERVQSLAISKQTQIVFLLTGKCSDDTYIGMQQYQAYHTLAKATSGQVFHMDKEEVGEILNYIANVVENRKTKLIDATFPPGEHKLKFTVDGAMKDTTVAVTGKNPRAAVQDSKGEKSETETLVHISGGVILKMPDPAPDEYTVTLRSDSKTSVSVSAETTVNFRHGFSILEPTSLSATTAKPIAGEKSYVSIQLLTSEDDIELRSIDIVDMADNIILGAPLKVINEEQSFYATEPLVSPSNLFKIAINAFDHKSNTTIRRYSLTPIEPQKPGLEPVKTVAPTVEIVEELNIQVEYRKSLKLTCKVTAYPKPDIIWMEMNSKTIMVSREDAMVEYPYEYVSILQIEQVDKNATYRCTATNTHGTKDSDYVMVTYKRTYYFDVIETPTNIAIEYGERGSVTCKIDAYPPATITWRFKGTELRTSDNIQIGDDSLTINNMDIKLAGKYTCEAKNDFNTSLINFNITATGLETPAINKNITEITVLKGSNTYIICSIVRGIPTPIVSWFFKSIDSPRYNIIVASAHQPDRLYLEKVTSKHSGTYKCIARNDVGRDNHFIDLNVEYAPTIKPDVKKKIAKEGSRQILRCLVDAVPTAHVRWFLNDNLITPSGDFRVYRDHSLRIIASLENSGVYKCEAENIHGKATKDISIEYFVPVNIKIPEDSTVVTSVGRSLKLPCLADGHSKPTIRWTFFSLDPKELPIVLRTSDPQAFSLKNVQLKQDGFYTCTAKNIGEMANITYRVIVNAPPTIVNADKSNIYRAVEGDLVLRVPCEAIGNPKPKIFWSFRDLNIATGTEWYDMEEDGTLVIKNIDIKSRGYFKCRAENKLGSDEKLFLVDVSRVPYEEKPTSFVSVRESETVDLKCGAPYTKVDKLRWYKNNRLIAENELRLEKVTPFDAGVYTCRVSNFSGSVSASTDFTVGFAPKFESEVDVDFDFDEGSYVELDCLNQAEPEASTQWFYEGKKLDAEDMMHAFVMEYSNMGQYMCVVSNDYGSINRTFSIKPPGCLLNILEDFQGNQPLMVPPRHLTLKTINRYLHIPRYETIKLVCPERFTLFSKAELTAICEQNADFRVDGNSYKFTELSCTSLMTPQVKKKGFRCGKGNTELVDVGYPIDEGRNFLPVYEVCVDKHNRTAIYMKHTLHQSLANVDPKERTWQDSDLVPFDFKRMYSCDAQRAYISKLLGKSFHEDDGCCFGKRQLLSPKDVMPGLYQAATYNYLNVIPQWSTCNTRNWNVLEQRIRTLAKSSSNELLVWTGQSTHEPLVLKTKFAEDRLVDLRPQLVSTYLWKVVQDTTSRSSLAIIQVNIPDLKNSDNKKYTLCTDICNEIEWMRDRSWDNVGEGYTYCCEIRDFEKAFEYKNLFSPSGDRILEYVSLITHRGLTV